jgi:alkylation response protein AidB-like acyl-CoA dehydrogenase
MLEDVALEAPAATHYELTPTQRELREEVRRQAERFDLEYWREHDKHAEYPHDFVAYFAEQGWLGAVVPEEYGGVGLGLLEASLILEAICASGAGTTGAAPVHFFMFPPQPIVKFGSEEMKRTYLPRVASGELTIAFGVSEPTAGSDTSRIETRAEKVDGGYVVSGQKVWTSNALNSDHVLLLARTSPRDESRPFEGLTLFFTALDRAHCEVVPIEKLGRAAVDSNELFIEGLRIPDEDVIGEVGRGFYHLIAALNPERVVIAMEAIGIGRAALRIATEYAKERIVFDRPIGKNQAIAHPLAAAWAKLEAAELLALKAASMYDAERKDAGQFATAAKYLAAEAGFEACDRALQTLGGFGYAKEYHVERLWREVRLYGIAPISQEMALNFIAHRVLELPKSY